MTKLKIASLSDIHLGHKVNKTADIIANLMIAFPDNAETADLDFIFIAGDVFEQLLSLPDLDVFEIKTWITYLLRLCKKHDIIIWVLEGTPRHDWKQSKIFEDINLLADIGANLKYVSTLSIEHEQTHGITCLFVPDEWEATTEKTLSQVKNLLKEHGLEKVDYAIMHGQFDYQAPEFQDAQRHDSEEYLKLVRHLIFIGHIHTYSHYKRIIAHGSFDRLRQKEEEPKGHVRVTVNGDDDYEITFVETKGAKIFKTIDCTDLDINAILEKVDKAVEGAPDDSYFRILANDDNPILTNMPILIRRYPLLQWSKKAVSDVVTEKELNEAEREDAYIPIQITPSNICGLMEERLINGRYSEDVLQTAMRLLHESM